MTMLSGWSYPETMEEALALLMQDEPRWEPVAGGSSWAFRRRTAEVGLMDLTRLPLAGITVQDGMLQLGATLTVEALRRAAAVRSASPMLHDVGESMRPRQLRNAVTVGGNIVQVFPWSDFPVAVLACGGRIQIVSPPAAARTEQTADEFFASHPRRRLERQLVTGILVPADGPGWGSAFLKLARSRVDLALVSAAARVRVEGGRVAEARVALGALHGLPERVSAVEQALVGAAVDEAGLAARLAELTRQTVHPVHDLRVSREYRCHVAGVQVGRVVERAIQRALGQAEG